MMGDPLVSVIIPTYNRASLIGQSLKSALNQTYRNCEIIVVDDGSTDNTRQVVESFGSVIRYIYKDNSGPSVSRNVGIREAKGEYVAFLDSDDLWEPTKVAKQVDVFLKNPKAALVSCNYRFIDQINKVVKDPGSAFGYQPDDFFVKDILQIRFPFGATTAFMIKRSVFDEVGFFNENLRISEDLDLLVRIGLKFTMAYVDEVLISVRLHDNHLMRETPRYQVWLDSIRVFESHADAIKERIPDMNTYLARFYSIAGNSALLSGNRHKALGLHWQVIRHHPFSWKGYKDCLRCFLPASYLKARNDQALAGSLPKGLERYK